VVKSLPSFLLSASMVLFVGATAVRADDSPEPEPNVVSGVAVAADGKPIGGATVVRIARDGFASIKSAAMKGLISFTRSLEISSHPKYQSRRHPIRSPMPNCMSRCG